MVTSPNFGSERQVRTLHSCFELVRSGVALVAPLFFCAAIARS